MKNLFYFAKDELTMKNIKSPTIIVVLLIVIWFNFVISAISYKHGFNKGKKDEITEKDVVLLYIDSENNSFSKKNFYEYLKRVNVKFPELVFAQAMKESGFTSRIWKDNHNPFGMKQATKRPNMQSGVLHNHATYDTWKHAIIDYAFYQIYIGINKMKTKEDYLQYLKEMNYYDVNHPGNVHYLDDLRNISDNIENYIKE